MTTTKAYTALAEFFVEQFGADYDPRDPRGDVWEISETICCDDCGKRTATALAGFAGGIRLCLDCIRHYTED